jgi:hypothetical protein
MYKYFWCLKINQYSTRLFVSYSQKNPITQKYAPKKDFYQVGSGLTCKYYPKLERLTRDKRSSLFAGKSLAKERSFTTLQLIK